MSEHDNPPTPPPPSWLGAGHSGRHDPFGGTTQSHRSMAVADLAADHPQSRLDRALQWVPRVLSSKPHILWLMLLGVYLIVLPLIGIAVSAKAELIGGNYTNVTSDIGACIAAGGTLHLINQGRRRQKLDAERLTLLKEVHALLHHVHPDAAAALGQSMPPKDADHR
ncbi:MAG TPA: hypothetical protein VF843_01220 [Streptosporangiaceae bacterium]